MPRLLFGFCAGAALVAFACNDEFVETVPQELCYSEMRWIGGKRGSPEMYPGEDCVGCHLDNDGPQLVIGGTLYPYSPNKRYSDAQAEHCFGVEGIKITIEDDDGLILEVETNRAGNFYVEGNPEDFVKPFNVVIEGYEPGARTPMFTRPTYGGCGRCHNPYAPPPDPPLMPDDPEYRAVTPRIGLFNYHMNGPDGPTVDEEMNEIADSVLGPVPPR